jgi:hypothetical protein
MHFEGVARASRDIWTPPQMALNPNLLASFLSIPFTFNLLPLPLRSIPLSVLFLSCQVRLVVFFSSPPHALIRGIHALYASFYTASLKIAAPLTDH